MKNSATVMFSALWWSHSEQSVSSKRSSKSWSCQKRGQFILLLLFIVMCPSKSVKFSSFMTARIRRTNFETTNTNRQVFCGKVGQLCARLLWHDQLLLMFSKIFPPCVASHFVTMAELSQWGELRNWRRRSELTS